jgi:hypothetical protein
MATMTKQYYESLSDKERTLLLKAVSTDNLLRGMTTFQEYCAAQQKRAADRLQRGFLLGFFIGLLIAAAFALVLFGGR